VLQGGGTTDAPFPGEVQSFLDYLATSDDAAGFPAAPQLEEAGCRGPEGPGAHLPKALRGYLSFGMQKGL
jgi:hypothetical protein